MRKLPLCIIPAAGSSTRMGEMCKDWPKWALEINGVPILDLVLRFWHRYADSSQVVVQPRFRATAFDIIERGGWIGTAHISEDQDPQGVPGTVLRGLEDTSCPPQFIVALADCLFDGEFEMVDLEQMRYCCGMAVCAEADSQDDWARSYTVDLRPVDEVSGVRIGGLMEKPTKGLGGYWLNWSSIRSLEENRNASMTHVFAELVRAGQVVKPVRHHGRYLNCTYPEDLNRWQQAGT